MGKQKLPCKANMHLSIPVKHFLTSVKDEFVPVMVLEVVETLLFQRVLQALGLTLTEMLPYVYHPANINNRSIL